MFENKKVNMAISIVVAALIWAYVIGSINPPAESKFRNIPISLSNTEVLENEGLAVSKVSAEYLDLVLSGSRSDISQLRSDEIRAVVDLSNALEGENEFTIDVHVPDGIEIQQKSISKLVVEVEKIETRTVGVEIVYSGQTQDDSEPKTLSVSQEEVEIRGARSLVNKVESARGTVDITKVSENETSESITLVPVDDSGAQVENVKITPASVTVASVLTHDKTVDLNVRVEDNSENAADKTWTAPDEVVIAGSVGDLKKIDSIDTEIIDISNVTEEAEIEIVPLLPEGVYLSDKNEKLTLTVTVEGDTGEETEKTFSAAASEITFEGAEEGISYALADESVQVTVRGPKDEMEAFRESDVSLSVDVSGLQPGQSQQVSVKAVCSKSGITVSVNPGTVTVTAE